MITSSLPLLLILQGSPASGKSSLAVDLARALHLPLLSRDDIKEGIMDILPVDDVETSHVIGASSFVALYRVLDRQLELGIGAVLESTFQRGRSEADLTERFGRCSPVQIHVSADPATIKNRLAERITTGSRHPGHQDAAAYVEIETAIREGVYDPLDVQAPLIRVDTTGNVPVDLDSLIAEIQSSIFR
jgi:predicted kinase